MWDLIKAESFIGQWPMGMKVSFLFPHIFDLMVYKKNGLAPCPLNKRWFFRFNPEAEKDMDFVLEKTNLGLYNHPYVIKRKRRKSKCFLVGACYVTCLYWPIINFDSLFVLASFEKLLGILRVQLMWYSVWIKTS